MSSLPDDDDGDTSKCPFYDWLLYCPLEWDVLDDDNRLQVHYAAKLFCESFKASGVLLVRNIQLNVYLAIDYDVE